MSPNRPSVNPLPPSRRALLLAVAATFVAGCAALAPSTPEQRVQARAQQRWDALIAGDVARAYGFLSPASRSAVPLDTYKRSFGNASAWKSAKVNSVRCEAADRCVATVVISHQPLALRGKLGTLESALDETWLLDDGEWWFPFRP